MMPGFVMIEVTLLFNKTNLSLPVPENEERMIRSQLRNGGHAPDSQTVPLDDRNSLVVADQVLQNRLLAAGLLIEIKPPITDPEAWQGRQAVPIEGEPLSEMIIRKRR